MTRQTKTLITVLLISLFLLSGCTTPKVEKEAQVVNLYTDRHYDTDAELYELFTKETGIVVNVVKAKSDELIERLDREGEDTEADLLITTDAGRLFRAKDKNLLQVVNSSILEENVPANLKDIDNEWFGLTVRARVFVYAKDRISPEQFSTYENLTESEWNGKILVRTSGNIYNLSLIASFIEIMGEEATLEWAKGIANNLARVPAGNDRAQAKAVVAGEGDVAIMNTYYIGKMLNSADEEEVKVAKAVGVFFPNQETTGTHINVSGIGLTKYANNTENAIKLMEFLSGKEAQKQYAEANFEYPVNPNVEPAELLKSWGEFKAQDINLTKLGENSERAVQLLLKSGWQ